MSALTPRPAATVAAEPARGRGWSVLVIDDGQHDYGVAAAIAAGALGAIPTPHSFEALLRAVLAVAAGRPV